MFQVLETLGWWVGWSVFGLWLAVLVWWTWNSSRQNEMQALRKTRDPWQGQ